MIDFGVIPRVHRCEICGKLYDCSECHIRESRTNSFYLYTPGRCSEEFRCPRCPVNPTPPHSEKLTAEERLALEEL
jgi:recombinational DNA repair protein (RecF pathway)